MKLFVQLRKKKFTGPCTITLLGSYVNCAPDSETKAEISHVGNFTEIGQSTEESFAFKIKLLQLIKSQEVLIKSRN